MIKNINLMQNPHDIAWDRYSEEYVIQALANLGQRVGIKGDGIAYKSFTFNDILTRDLDFDPNTYIGYIEYIKSNDEINLDSDKARYKANFGIAKKNDLNDIVNIDTTLSINDVLYFPSELSFTIPINNVEKYSKNSICANIDDELTFILAEKAIGYEDTTENNTTLIYEKYDINTNKLKYGAKLFYFCNKYPDEYYCLITVKNNELNSRKLSNKYMMTIYLFNLSNIKDSDYRVQFKNLFKFSNYNNADQLKFNLIAPEFINIERMESYADEYSSYYESNSPIAMILNNKININTYVPQKINLVYDSESNQFLAQDGDQYESILNLYNNEFELNLDEEIFLLNNDISNLYFNIFNYYNEKFYLEDRTAFIKRILAKTYEKTSNYDYTTSSRLYVPLDYEFHYICNSNNEMLLYYSNNIYVTKTSLKIPFLTEFWENNNNLIYDYDGIDKVKAYNFEINYNKADSSLINSVSIKEIYTMPYINANENWSINDTDTKIKAIGADAGNPNIIIIFNNDSNNLDNSYEILNAVSNKKYIIGSEYELTWFKVNNALFENAYTDTIYCCAYIPKIDESNFEYFKHSVILSISDLNCLDSEDNRYKYKGSYILTLWHLIIDEKNNYKFECIHQTDKDYSLALGSTVNLLNEIDDESIGNLNAQDLILLKSILSTVGQERLAINNNNWLILKNKQSEEYYSSSDRENLYNNDLNAIVQYNDNIAIKSNHIIHSQNNKYVPSIGQFQVTNSLYPKYEIKTTITTGTEAVTNLKRINNSASRIRESRISIKGQYITNIETLLEELENSTVEVEDIIEKEIQIEEAQKIEGNYNEYIFNSNIPSVDLKEVFNRNVNVLNRVNIISLDYNGVPYNAYIGSSYNESNKEVLHIGTTETNINIGTDTLLNEVDKSKFNKHNTISIDFDNIILNAKTKLLAKQNLQYQYNYNSINYNFMSSILIGPCMTDVVPNDNRDSHVSWNNNSTEIFAKQINNNIETLYISLNNIFKKMFNINLANYKNNVIIENNYNSSDVKIFARESMNDVVYLYKLPNDLNAYANLPNDIIYVPVMLNILYYINSETINGVQANIMHIYISFNK